MISWDKFKHELWSIPSVISYSRLILGVLLPYFIFHENPSFHIIACFVFGIGAITDWFDGWVARKYDLVSDFGKILDPTVDKIFILIPLVAFVHLGYFHIGWVIPIFAREIVITFCRIGWMLENRAIGAEMLGKVKFFFQSLAVGFGLAHLLQSSNQFPFVPAPLVTIGMQICLIVSTLLTLISGYTFIRANRENFKSPQFAKFTAAFGVGFFSFAPGTWGTLVGLCLVALTFYNKWLLLATFGFLLWISFYAVSRIDLSANKDPHFVVADEVLGVFVPYFFFPLNLTTLLIGFFFFRAFDVIKPFPLRRLEYLPKFWGILADDLGAGVYTAIVIWIFYWVT